MSNLTRALPVHQFAPLPDLPEIPGLGASIEELRSFLEAVEAAAPAITAAGVEDLSVTEITRLERLADASDDARTRLSAHRVTVATPGADDALRRVRSALSARPTDSSGAGLPPMTRPPVTTVTSARTAAAGEFSMLTPGGVELRSLRDVGDEFLHAFNDLQAQVRTGSDIGNSRATIATAVSTIPEARRLTRDPLANKAIVDAITSREALAASGGLCAPLEPYYDILVIAGAQRPVRDALPVFGAERGGVQLVPPPTLSAVGPQARTVNDAATTNGTNAVTSATARFVSYDVGATITGSGIPAGALIVAVSADQTTATISANATATASGVSITVTRPGATSYITAAADALGLTGTAGQVASSLKPCLHISCSSIQSFTVAAVTRCLEVGNFSSRTFPEQVTAWLELAMAYQARLAETQLLNQLSSNSTQVTQAQALGVARDIIPTVVKMAAYYRQHNRMPADAVLRWIGPAWLLDAMVADAIRGSGYDSAFIFGQVRRQVEEALGEANIAVSWYEDSGTGKGQFFNSGNAQAAGAATTFPGTAVHYLFSEGSFLFLDGGTLDLGIVRDSTLNAQNNYRIFAETFEALAYVGVESLEVTSTIAVNGAASAAITPPAGL